MKRMIVCLSFILLSIVQLKAQQVADEQFHYPIADPHHRIGDGPLLLFDEAHNNPVTLRGTYAAFSTLLQADGYRLRSAKEKINLDRLKEAKIFISVNALYDPENWSLPARSAFTDKEIELLRQWVNDGGNLFLVTDHMPCGGSLQALAAVFGIHVMNGFALRKDGRPEIFSRDRKTLLPNEITAGSSTEIDSIMCWGGTGFKVPATAQIMSLLDDEYEIYLPTDANLIKRPIPKNIPRLPGKGFANGAYLRFGKGRIVIFGDGAPFSAQLYGIKSEQRGMNHPSAYQNAQLLLNIVHWLDQ
ncbi:hypothetical protein BV902_21140 [Sphingobacterium sp. B29]|uniref:hypothetical protein n=1 Tax=Sphingobacterium sp. B29 TaxID=1933220 RepID=UPI00095875B4|nr:hypothetical protein [Sphingobacterium sp. B29]APU98534.1 hypothetical protein BV902_21140 [Sphingobacterium sp. B29]